LHEDTTCVIGNGVVVDPRVLVEELKKLKARGVDIGHDRLKISKHAHLIMPYHVAVDLAREVAKGDAKIGTTGRGIGPCYEDKVGRRGIRVGDLAEPEEFKKKLHEVLKEKNFYLTKYLEVEADGLQQKAIYEEYLSLFEIIKPYVVDTSVFLTGQMKNGKAILFEGAQGTSLDIDHGTYPFVTSSNTVSGNATTGCGIGPTCIDEVVGVSKAYTTRVGSGPFPTEQDNEIGKHMQDKGGEFGATTGRPRRCGWFDAVIARHAVRVNGLTGIIITKLDVLSGLDEIKVATRYELDGNQITEIPGNPDTLARCKPIYESFPGWEEDIREVKTYEELPEKLKSYLKNIENLIEAQVVLASIGPDRIQSILIRNPFE
jgi:adenylosuccinate synthase